MRRVMKILIVDDNEDNRVLQETVLKAKGFTVEVAEDGDQALQVAVNLSLVLPYQVKR